MAVSLDPHQPQETHFEAPLWEFGLPDDGALAVEELMRGQQLRLVRQGAALAVRAAGAAVRDLPHPPAGMTQARYMDMDTVVPKSRRKRRSAPRADFNADPLWYKDAVIYQLHVKSFFDANNDGIGDFAGLIEKLDYIAELGVNTDLAAAVLSEPAPRRRLRHLRLSRRASGLRQRSPTSRRFIAEAHARGLRVVTELVINHTSDQHPWFQRARRAPSRARAARDFYVWSDTDSAMPARASSFVDTEKSNWTWDPVANAYYWHRFYSHQPDLNFDNPRVLNAHAVGAALLAGDGRGRLPARRGALSGGARGHQ